MKLIIDISRSIYSKLKSGNVSLAEIEKILTFVQDGDPLSNDRYAEGVANGYRMALQDLEIIKKEGEKE